MVPPVDMSPTTRDRIPYSLAARELLRNTLLDAARDELESRRWADITMADIAGSAGVSRQTLYKEFGSRDEFAQALVLREAERFLVAVEEAVRAHLDNPATRAVGGLRRLPHGGRREPARALDGARRRRRGPARPAHHARRAARRRRRRAPDDDHRVAAGRSSSRRDAELLERVPRAPGDQLRGPAQRTREHDRRLRRHACSAPTSSGCCRAGGAERRAPAGVARRAAGPSCGPATALARDTSRHKMAPMRLGLLSTARINELLVAGARLRGAASTSSRSARATAHARRRRRRRSAIPRAHGSYEALLADPDVEAVYIALPNSLHVEWSLRALEAGRHVLCEKPMSRRPDDVARAFDVAERDGLVLAEAFMWRHHPQAHRLARAAAGDRRAAPDPGVVLVPARAPRRRAPAARRSTAAR